MVQYINPKNLTPTDFPLYCKIFFAYEGGSYEYYCIDQDRSYSYFSELKLDWCCVFNHDGQCKKWFWGWWPKKRAIRVSRLEVLLVCGKVLS